jgi:membrane protein YdbS with pleckstrin-like domain
MKIAQSKTREQFPLSYKKVIKKTITVGMAWIVLFLIAGGLLIGSSGSGVGVFDSIKIVYIGILIVLIIILMLIYFYQRWYYAVYFYDLTDNYIIIKKGPITPSEITVPFERIQDVYVDQDLFDRFFGLYDVHISSATFSSGIAAHIDGVEKVSADGLKAIILDKVHEKISIKR